MDALATDGIAVLIPPQAAKRKGERPGWTGGRYSWMRRYSPATSATSSTENVSRSIEPVFGHTKHNRKFTQFHRRGRALCGPSGDY